MSDETLPPVDEQVEAPPAGAVEAETPDVSEAPAVVSAATGESPPDARQPDTGSVADLQARFLRTLRTQLATSNYGVSASVDLSFTESGLLLLTADDAQEAVRAASAVLTFAPEVADARDGWRYVGAGPDLDTGRYRAVVRIGPLA